MRNGISKLLGWVKGFVGEQEKLSEKTTEKLFDAPDDQAGNGKEPGFMEKVGNELTRLGAEFDDRESAEFDGRDQTEVSGSISESFVQMMGIAPDDSQRNRAWMKYFGFSVRYIESIPDALLTYLNDDNYRTVFAYVKNYIDKHSRKGSADGNKMALVMQLCEYILTKINPSDIPALLLMGQINRMEGDYISAEKYYGQVAAQEGGFHGVTALADCYNDELSAVLGMLRTDKGNADLKAQAQAINRAIRDLYVKHETGLKEQIRRDETDADAKRNYVILATKHARWEKTDKSYRESLRILQQIPADYPEYHRVLLEQGLLYQYKGSERRPNDYYDMDRAIEMLRQADEAFTGEETINGDAACARKSILIPLANSLFAAGRPEEAENICKTVLGIDPREKKALDLIKKIRQKDGDRIDGHAI